MATMGAGTAAARAQTTPGATTGTEVESAAKKQTAKSVRADALRAIESHFTLWSRVWRQSENERGANHNPFGRGVYQHCHNERNAARFVFRAMPEDYRPITSAYTAFALCPSWYLGAPEALPDEAEHVDAPIAAARVNRVVASRAALLNTLELAADVLPTDGAIAGQRVRFLVEQSSLDSALSVARFCRADAWWCTVLEGYVQQRRGHLAEAESVFARARRRLSDADRCAWEDIQPLIPIYARAPYAKASCAQQHATNDQYWWLADPLFADSGNERRVLHEARRVEAMLHAALPKDSRYKWTAKNGGDALAELVQRYGWPSYMAWGGVMLDLNHSDYLRVAGSKESEPYTTYEYARGRVHTAPDWPVVKDGVHATVHAWSLNDTLNNDRRPWWPQEHFARPRNLVQLTDMQMAMLRRDSHVLLATAHQVDSALMAALGDGSRAVLMASTGPGNMTTVDEQRTKTQETVILRGNIPGVAALASVELLGARVGGRRYLPHVDSVQTDSDSGSRDSTGRDAVARTDASRDRSARDRAAAERSAAERIEREGNERERRELERRVRERLARDSIDREKFERDSSARDSSTREQPGDSTRSGARVDSIRVADNRNHRVDGTDARTRFGIVPPPTLDAMKPGEYAVSEPVLLRVPDVGTDLASLGDDVLSRMFGTLRFDRRTRRIGVYWESYGFRAEDSVTVSVQLERHVAVNPLKRLAVVVGVATDPNSTITISWREPDVAHSTRTLSGAVPVQIRALTLDIGNLAHGDYDVVVSVGKPGVPAASNRRRIAISR